MGRILPICRILKPPTTSSSLLPVHTDYGWSYESDWEWGWAPFHYGRWYLDQGYGWVWIPGSAWAPAWVSWRYGGGYVGWAPLPPAGSAIVIETHHPYWCFVEARYLVVRDVYHYAMPVQNNHLAFSATVTVQQTMSHGGANWSPGPPAAQLSREIGQPIHTATITPPPGGAVQAHRISLSPAHATGAPSGTAAHPNASAAAHERAQGIDHGEGEHERGREGGAVEHEHEHEHPGYASPESHGQANAPPPPPAGKRKRR